MQVQVAETSPCGRTVTITVPPDRVKKHVDQVYAAAAQQVKMPGFRPGKVPRQMIEKRFGEGILQEAKEQLVNGCVSEALQEKKLTVVGRVHVEDYEKIDLGAAKGGLELVVKFDIRPDFELKDPKGIEVDAFPTEVTDQDIDAALQEIANQKRAIRKVDEPVQAGDFVKVDLRFRDGDGAQVHERKGVQINTGIPVAGTDPEAFQQALIGASAGATLELPIHYPDTFEKEAVRGKDGKVELSLHEVLRVTAPMIDDALAKTLDFDSLDALKQDLRERIGGEKVRVGRLRQEEQVLEVLLNDHPFDLPGSLVEEQTQGNLQAFEQRLKQGGMADDEVAKKVEESKAEAHNDAQRRVRLFFLLDAIARREKLQVTEQDMIAEVDKIAEQNNASRGQVIEYLQKQNQVGELRLALMERKVRDFLRDNARIVDKKGT